MSRMMRITDLTGQYLDQLSKNTDLSKQDLIEKAILLLVKQEFLERTNKQYAALVSDKNAHADMEKELQEWDVTLSDGLEDKPWQD